MYSRYDFELRAKIFNNKYPFCSDRQTLEHCLQIEGFKIISWDSFSSCMLESIQCAIRFFVVRDLRFCKWFCKNSSHHNISWYLHLSRENSDNYVPKRAVIHNGKISILYTELCFFFSHFVENYFHDLY